MADRDFYDTLLDIAGPPEVLKRFSTVHLANDVFTFNSIDLMPADLDYEFSNFVEDGYEGLFGDWRNLADRWVFKEAASDRGYPFPLESREQVLDCITALGQCGEEQLRLGRLYKQNLDTYGYGHCLEWRRARWGTELDADELVAEVEPNRIRIAFSTYGAPPMELLRRYATQFPAMAIRVDYLNEWGKRPGAFSLESGKQKRQSTPTAELSKSIVWGFRRSAGLQWLRVTLAYPAIVDILEMNERGRARFKGAGMALTFALERMAAGEDPDALAKRFPTLETRHVEALKALASCSNRQAGSASSMQSREETSHD
jgi:uncharacterized protein (DUF433 family)